MKLTLHKKILIGVASFVLAIAICVGTVAGIAYTTARESVKESENSVASYIDEVIQIAESSDDVSTKATRARAVAVPAFKEVPFGGIYPGYAEARSAHGEAVNNVEEFIKKLEGYASVLAFYEDYTRLEAQRMALVSSDGSPSGRSRDKTYLQKNYEIIKDINARIKKTTVASDYADEFVELGRVYSSMELSSEGVLRALELSNEIAYDTLYQQYTVASNQIERVQEALGTYKAAIPGKIEEGIRQLQTDRIDV